MEEKEKKIYTSAIKLFWKYWPKKVSIDDIIKEAEVWKWTFYKYFSNKENLYKIIIDNIFENVWKRRVEDFEKILENSLEEFILSHYLWYLFFTEKNIFLKNIFLWNKEFYFWEVDFEYIRKMNHKMALENTNFIEWISDEDKIFFVESIYVFVKSCLFKKESFKEDDYEKFCLDYANIFTFWYLQNKKFLKIDLKEFRKKI